MGWTQEAWWARELVLPVLDVLIVAWLVYKVWGIIAETRAIPALKGLFVIVLVTVAANLFALETLGWVLEKFLAVAAIALIVLFQPELRRVLMKMGQGRWLSLYMPEQANYLAEVVEAVGILSQRRVGALVVFEREVGLKNYIETGTTLDAEVSYELLLTMFAKNTPLHDGAAVVQHKRLTAAGCFLPLSSRTDIKKSLGTRHRAAVGLTEETDAVALVVSEETGAISISVDGRLRYDLNPEKLQETLEKLLGESRRRPLPWWKRGKR